MSVYSDVVPVYVESKECGCEMIKTAIESLKKDGMLEAGDVLVTAGTQIDENTSVLG